MAVDLPRVVAITGSQEFLQRRQVQSSCDVQRKNGWRVEIVDGADQWAIKTALTQGGGLFSDTNQPVLVVVRNPDKADLTILEAHQSDKESKITLLLSYEDDPKMNTKFGKFLQGLGTKAHMAYPLAEKKWDLPKEAVKFCMVESKKMGKPMEENVAEALVRRCGTDYGFLNFELTKFALLAESRGLSAIGAAEVRESMAAIGEMSFDGIKDALISRSRVRLATALDKIGKTSKDPIMGLCGFIDYLAFGKKADTKGGEGRPSFGWFHLALLVEQGLPPDEIADTFGINRWYCQNKLLPEVRRWTPKDILRLIEAGAQSRRAVLNGAIDPWIGLVARLLSVAL